MTLEQHMQAIAEGRGTPADVDAALGLCLAGETFEAVRSDWLADAPTMLAETELAAYKPAHRLRAMIHQHEHDDQLAMLALIEAAGDPPDPEIVQEALDLGAVGASPEREERFFLARVAAIGEPLERAVFLAHVAAIHFNVGLDEAARAWMDRARAAAPDDARVPAITAYFEANRLGYARALIR